MHDLPIIINISVALLVAFLGGAIARQVGLPTIVGYLLGGIVISPFTPGFVGDVNTLSQLAELGVIFLMFAVGLHFSLKDLWQVRAIAIPGAIFQMTASTLLGIWVSQSWGWSLSAGIVLGLALSMASTVVLLRGLMDNGLLNTPHGQAAVGWLVLEDLTTVVILLLLPAFSSGEGAFSWANFGWMLLKAGFFVVLVFVIGEKLIGWLFIRISKSGSRELFLLAVLAVALSVAMGAAEIFGVSIALGAFLAGVIISGSPHSHQVSADVLPFRDTFAALFFVSVGMLVDPLYLLENWAAVLTITALVVLGKPLIVLGLGMIFPWPAHTSLVVAAGLSQIGEFSFILGQAGMQLGIINAEQYSLILAGSLVSITLNPFTFRLIAPLEKGLKKLPFVWRRLEHTGNLVLKEPAEFESHVVIVGYGRIGRYIANLLAEMDIPILVVELEPTRVKELAERGINTLYGDAANSEILVHARLPDAKTLIVTGIDEASNLLTVAAARQLAPNLPIIAQAMSTEGLRDLKKLGAQQVVQPALEGGLEMVQLTLTGLGFSTHEIVRYKDRVRKENFDLDIEQEVDNRLLRDLINTVGEVEIEWHELPADSPLAGITLEEANLRALTGASVIALVRGDAVFANPKSRTTFTAGDRIGLIGEAEQLALAAELLGAVGSLRQSPDAPVD